MDSSGKHFLDLGDIYNFLKSNSTSVAYARAERVLKRLDGDLDGKISFDDWITALLPEDREASGYLNRTSSKLLEGVRICEN